MGTRNLTAVYLDGEYKVAQYGQWDGYPDGEGMTTLMFARKLKSPEIMEDFKNKVRLSRWITTEELDDLNARVKSGEIKNWQKEYPEMSRDVGAEILNLVLNSENGLKLHNDLRFAASSLWCEWAWVIDLDNGTFEGYRGFNNTPLTENDRFYFLRKRESDGYHGVRLAAKWSLDELPEDWDFLAAFKENRNEN